MNLEWIFENIWQISSTQRPDLESVVPFLLSICPAIYDTGPGNTMPEWERGGMPENKIPNVEASSKKTKLEHSLF